MAFIRDDEADIRVSVDGKPIFGSWATYDGGDLVAADVKTRTGGMGKSVSVGGPADRSDITITTQFNDVVAGRHNEIEGKVGNGRVNVSVQYLNPDRTAIPGGHFTRVGTLKQASLPKMDANTNNVSFYTLIVSANELAG